MITLGVMLKSNVARLLTLSGTKESHKIVAPKVNKIDLAKNPSRDDVDVFVQAFKSICTINSVDLVVVNRRATSGQGAGGAATFITEGVLLATSPCPVMFVHSATIKATDRKNKALKTQSPTTVDLAKAYDLAFEGLPVKE